MATNIMVRPPTRPSSGATTIRRALGLRGKLLRRDDMTPVPAQYNFVINWGNSNPFAAGARRVFNAMAAIAKATNKLVAFQTMQAGGVRVPEFQTAAPTPAKGTVWLARTTLHGSGGEGIVVIREGGAVPRAPLYVKYVPKLREFRAHVAFGRVIFLQEKKRKVEGEQTDDQKLIRNHDNGWVFCINDLVLTDADRTAVGTEAVKAVVALGLDFGAVDLILGKKDNLPYILEVNTAPGLESPGLIEAYKNAFLAQCPDRAPIVRKVVAKKVLKKKVVANGRPYRR